MFKAFVLVRNLKSSADSLDFGEFRIRLIGSRFKELREVFSSVDVNENDWVFEKPYTQLPPGPPGSPVGGIPNDIEDVLLLLRLFKVGEISFIKTAIVPPNGNNLVQFPYRAMNDLNSYSYPEFDAQPMECEPWKAFAADIRASPSWRSGWFAAAKRFFLCGGAKRFNPGWDDVDRILDYATALEATLVPEKDYNTRRLSHRAAALLEPGKAAEADVIVKFIKKFYEIRSRMVHGSGLGDENRKWLLDNCEQVELRVRSVLTAAVRALPPEENGRRAFLAGLYDPTDQDRGDTALDKFREIKTDAVRKAVVGKIAQLSAR